MGNRNFDNELKLKKGLAQYHLDKKKAGMSGSSAGQPRPYARQNVLYARLFSPLFIGKSFTITPKHSYLHFSVGKHYEWTMIEEGLGNVDGYEMEAKEIKDHFMLVPKRRQI